MIIFLLILGWILGGLVGAWLLYYDWCQAFRDRKTRMQGMRTSIVLGVLLGPFTIIVGLLVLVINWPFGKNKN